MPSDSQEFLQQCLLFDIEVNEHNSVYSIGAVFAGKTFLAGSGQKVDHHLLDAFDSFATGATCILGHNIINHDIPKLKHLAPSLQLLKKPAIDTLFLSPLAHPANPYHRLVKNYQLVRDSINDPVQDAVLAGKVFLEQWHALTRQMEAASDVPILYRSFLQYDANLTGTAKAMEAMGIPLLEGNDLYDAFSWLARRSACNTVTEHLVEQLLDGKLSYPPIAYVTAWLTVAGRNSVLPPWVRHKFPEVPVILRQLRENRCQDPKCEYCRENHDPQVFLGNFYGFEKFHNEPATIDGKSLQEQIVAAAAKNFTLFATLPTGGGKSLCYLLPALMRYQHRNLLTIVISPLQALMKDQVDNFAKQTGTKLAAALYGMLTMPERGEVMENVRLGDIGILFVSPEQLRNQSFIQTIRQREIGAWIFDEAHCLSKWGHDFRPDYLYAIRFIKEFAQKEKTAIPPVQCFTATAKKDVKAEICDIIQSQLGLRVIEFAGGHERTNLQYEVWPVETYEKNQAILELLRTRYNSSGSVVIYCATRKKTENLAELLQNSGYQAEAFHAGLDPSLKRRIQDNFIEGTTPIICATNAFGMGIDKDNVRIVIHADIPGSLENYLQEAGRAGRDRHDAECILIFDEQDIEGQFRLSSRSRLTQREISQFLRGVRYAAKGENSVVLTVGDLLRLEVVEIDPDDHPEADTRVRTAVSWLERAGYLQRNENHTRVFQGKPVVRNLEEAAAKIAALNLSARQQKRWLAILSALMERRPNQAFSADELAGLSAFSSTENDSANETETQRVIRTLHDMAEQGLLVKETLLTAYLRFKVQNSAEKSLQQISGLENDFIKVLQEAAPDVPVDEAVQLDLRQVNQILLDQGHTYSTPHILKSILYGLSRDGKGLAGNKGSIAFKAKGNNRFSLHLKRDWPSLMKTVEIRQQAARVALQTLLAKIAPAEKPNASLLVEFSLEEIVDGLKHDLLLLPLLKDPLAAAERALTAMHEHGVLELQQGLAVFRQAMTLQLNPEAKGRRYSQADFAPLKTHYTERNFQIHVMNEYARQALKKLSGAWQFVASYFNDEKEIFVKRFFPGKEDFLERATSEQSYLRIVDDLNNHSQEKIVAAAAEKNMLVLAGPGSGKTRVVAHRVAFLLRVKRVNPKAVLVLCFNRSAVMNLRTRLRNLVGDDMHGMTTLTFHGLALRLLGRSLVTAGPHKASQKIDFSSVISDAIKLLKGETEVLGFNTAPPHYALLGKFSHILVDEYQDIDADQYELVSLLAGKTLDEKDQKMTILAVGDDDQNIYHFRGANVGFIRKFRTDYKAEIHYLIENYRSTANIIAAGNLLITRNSDRMKTGYPIRVNKARGSLPPGGNRQISDPLTQGRVQIIEVCNQEQQAYCLLGEIRRLQRLENGFDLGSCAILAREWKDLDRVRAVFEETELPVSLNWGRDSAFPPLSRIRENDQLLQYLRESRLGMKSASSLLCLLSGNPESDNIWQKNLRRMIIEWQEETGDALYPVPAIEEYFYEALADQNRLKNIGNGIFLSTIHSVKGLEFDHVFILGESWQKGNKVNREEERRLFYVGMSRARETLHLFSVKNHPHPHLAGLSGACIMSRSLSPVESCAKIRNRYALLGMQDLFLDYAGFQRENHPARLAVLRLRTDNRLTIEKRNKFLELVNDEGVSVGRLSHAAENKWAGRLKTIREIRVLAMVKRYKEDISDKMFKERCYGESWETPIVELVYWST
ncbi:MAG: RecQ family ATP-dependent DNA helicase [Proteobacteria bacterium]|nr:RecQ family ATP-dependent DNA helicase [Pseudomonadota bacterium]